MNKKVGVIALVFLLSLSIALSAVSIENEIQSIIIQDSEVIGRIKIVGDGDSPADIVLLLPREMTLVNWRSEGLDPQKLAYDTKNINYLGKLRGGSHWQISDNVMNGTIIYTLGANKSGSYDIIALVTYIGGFTDNTKSVNIIPTEMPFCGNNICEEWENQELCPADCKSLAESIVKILTYDITKIIVAIVISSAILSMIIMVLINHRELVINKREIQYKTEMTQKEVEEFLTDAKAKGYSLREVAQLLKERGVEENKLKEIVSQELSKIDEKNKQNDKNVIRKDKRVIKKLERIAKTLKK